MSVHPQITLAMFDRDPPKLIASCSHSFPRAYPSKGFSLNPRQEPRNSPVHTKGHHRRRETRILIKEHGTDKGDAKNSALHGHGPERTGRGNIVPQGLSSVNALHGTHERIISVKASDIPAWTNEQYKTVGKQHDGL